MSLRDTDKVVFIGNSKDAEIKDVDIVQFPDNFIQIPIGTVLLFEGTEMPKDYEEATTLTAPEGYKYIKKVR